MMQKMTTSTASASVAFVIGWLCFLRSGFDGLGVIMVLAALLLGRSVATSRLMLSGFVLATVLGSVPEPCAIAFLVAALICGWITKPVRPWSSAEWALVVAGALMIAVFAAMCASPAIPCSPMPLVLAGSWWMIARLAANGPGIRVVRHATWPAVLVLGLWSWGAIHHGATSSVERQASEIIATARSEPDTGVSRSLVRSALRLHPWDPNTWRLLGNMELLRGDTTAAFHAFLSGYRILPRHDNPCADELGTVAAASGRWRLVADLVLTGVIRAPQKPAGAAFRVAAELWRQEHGDLALRSLLPLAGSDPAIQELAGWIAQDVGHDSLSLRLLLPLVAASPSGETAWRAALAAGNMGMRDLHGELIAEGADHHRLHRALADASGRAVPFAGMDHVGSPEGITLGNTVRLRGWQCRPNPASPGDTLTIRTVWEPTKPLPSMQVILHLDLDAPPRWRRVADFWPEGRRSATVEWPVGELVEATTRVFLPSDAPPGRYTVYTGMWIPGDRESRLLPGPADAHRVPRGELRFPLGEIVITGPDKAR